MRYKVLENILHALLKLWQQKGTTPVLGLGQSTPFCGLCKIGFGSAKSTGPLGAFLYHGTFFVEGLRHISWWHVSTEPLSCKGSWFREMWRFGRMSRAELYLLILSMTLAFRNRIPSGSFETVSYEIRAQEQARWSRKIAWCKWLVIQKLSKSVASKGTGIKQCSPKYFNSGTSATNRFNLAHLKRSSFGSRPVIWEVARLPHFLFGFRVAFDLSSKPSELNTHLPILSFLGSAAARKRKRRSRS